VYRAVVLTLFLMRRNESQVVAGELFGCSQSTVSRLVRRLRPLLGQANAELAGQVRAQAKRSAVLVDGFGAPTGNRAGVPDLFSGKRHTCGLNSQAVSDLAGRPVDTGLPVPGARHDSKALAESGIVDRWASHLRPGGPGMLADLGYLGTAAITSTRKPPNTDLTDVQRACNRAINSTRAAVERAIAHPVNWSAPSLDIRHPPTAMIILSADRCSWIAQPKHRPQLVARVPLKRAGAVRRCGSAGDF
jgi:hypothetical protein